MEYKYKRYEPASHRTGQIDEVCSGITDYFDVMLGTQLLYKFERPQYSDVRLCACVS